MFFENWGQPSPAGRNAGIGINTKTRFLNQESKPRKFKPREQIQKAKFPATNKIIFVGTRRK
jgi:hypothetical protein